MTFLRLCPGWVLLPRLLPPLLLAYSSLSMPALLGSQVVATVEVQVTDRTSGDPISRAEIQVLDTGHSASTDSRGTALLRGIPPGPHPVRITALGYRTETERLTAVNGRIIHFLVSLIPDPVRIPGISVASPDQQSGRMDEIQITVTEIAPGVTDLPSALERVPGVTMVRQGGPGAPAAIRIRGSGSNQVLVLLDGIPLNSPLTGEVDLASVDLSTLQRIVVLPGARSARFGPRAMGGVVLLESHRRRESGGALTLGLGAWDQRKVAGEARWTPPGSWGVATDAFWSRSRGDFPYDVPDFRGGGETRRRNAGARSVGGSFRVTHQGESATSNLRLHLSDIRRGSPGSVAQPSLTGVQKHRLAGVGLGTQVGHREMGASLTTDLQWQRGEYRDSTPPFGQPYHQVSRVTQRDLRLEGWRERGDLTLRAGGELRSLAIRSDALTRSPSEILEGGVWSRIGFQATPVRSVLARLALGLRVDGHELVRGPTWSPSLSGTLETEWVRAELAYRNGFSPPSLSDLFFQEGVLARPNPALQPERVRGEIALTLVSEIRLLGPRLTARASAYHADIDDMILWFPDFRFVWSPENFQVSRTGLEVGAEAPVPLLGRILTLSGQAEWSRMEYRGGVLSGQVVYRPRFKARIQGSWAWGEVTPTLSFSHVGSRRTVAGSKLNALSPYSLLDAGVTLPLTLGPVHGRIILSVSNLLDVRAALLADYPLPGRGWSVEVRLSTGGTT